VSDYDVALLYLGQAGYDLERATEAYRADDAWERNHPLPRGRRTGKQATRQGLRWRW